MKKTGLFSFARPAVVRNVLKMVGIPAMIVFSTGVFCVLSSLALAAEGDDKPKEKPVVVFDPNLQDFRQVLPHGQAFIIRYKIIDGVETPSGLVYWENTLSEDKISCAPEKRPSDPKNLFSAFFGPVQTDKDSGKFVEASMPPISYSNRYCFNFEGNDKLEIQKALDNFSQKVLTEGGMPESNIETFFKSPANLPTLYRRILPSGKSVPEVLKDLIWNKFGPSMHQVFQTKNDLQSIKGYRSADIKILKDRVGKLIETDKTRQFRNSMLEAIKFADSADFENADSTVVENQNGANGLKSDAKKFLAIANDAKVIATAGSINKEIQETLTRLTENLNKELKTSTDIDNAVKKLNQELAAGKPEIVRTIFWVKFNPSEGFTEKGHWYFSGDLGVLWTTFFEESHGRYRNTGGSDIATYVGANMFFTPIDKDIPLSVDDGPCKRLSIMFGYTLNDVKDKKDTYEGVIDGNALVTGLGIRLTDYLRVTPGALILRQKDRNPYVGEKHIVAQPFIAAGLDLDVIDEVKKILAKAK